VVLSPKPRWLHSEPPTRVRKKANRKEFAVVVTTISPKFQIVIPKEVREKLHLSPKQHLHVVAKGGIITLVPEVPLKSLRGALKGLSKTDLREKKDRS
jgi:AbrB family looped-hinge helix DNA binding protein